VQNRLTHYISGLSIVAAFTGLVSMAHSFFTGIAFYLAVTGCFLLALCCVVIWQKIERAKYVNQSLRAIFDRLSKKVDAEAFYQLVEIVEYFGMQDEVADTLGEMIYIKPDPTERYWLYIALGMIGGKRAKSIIEKSPTDDSEFAQNAAVEAGELLRKPERHEKKQDKLLGRCRAGEYLSAGLTLSLCAVIAAAAVYHKNLPLKPPHSVKNKTSTEAIQSPRTSDLNIIIRKGKGGDIWINMYNAKGDTFEISITPSISVSHIKIRI